MDNKLNFSEFQKATIKDWQDKVAIELKGRSIDELEWEFETRKRIKPFYTEGVGGEANRFFYRSEPWRIAQTVSGNTPELLNSAAKESLNGGIDELGLNVEFKNKQELIVALSGVYSEMIGLALMPGEAPSKVWHWYQELNAENGKEVSGLRVRMNYDPIGQACWEKVDAKWQQEFRALALFSKYGLTRGKPFLIDVSQVFERGGTSLDELVYGLSLGHEYLVQLLDLGYTIDEAAALLHFKFSVGTSYFKEIAKFRGFRKLWGQIIDRYEPEHDCSKYAFIHASTSVFLMSAMDQNNNLLRSTTAAMSGIIGGADVIEVLRHDLVGKHERDQFSQRIARNILHILKEEAFFDKMADPSEGSYYIEHLELEMISSAWEDFKMFEAKGGFSTQHSHETFQKRVADSLSLQRSMMTNGDRIQIGVNKFVNEKERLIVKDLDHQRLSTSMEVAEMKKQVLL